MAYELEKTLKVNDKEFNINAVQADKVANSLTVKNIGLSGQEKTSETVVFCGETPESISVVSAETGGRFNRAIRVPKIGNIAGEGNRKSDGTIHAEAVLNYEDIVDTVVDRLLNTSVIATWDGNELTFTDDESSAINGICVVLGNEAGIKSFPTFNNENWITSVSAALPGQVHKWLQNYLYICATEDEDSDGNALEATGNIYYGTANSTEVIKLATAAGNGQDITPRSIYIDKTRWIIPEPPQGAADYATYSSSGIDMHNSDITNINGLWFADASNSKNEGIIFLRNADGMDIFDLAKFYDKDGNHISVVGDRFYADNGKLYFNPNIVYYEPDLEDPEGGKNYHDLADENAKKPAYEVFHEGMTESIKIKNGGTGATTAEEARTSLEITPANIGAAESEHTHLYAGSSTVGGPANSAISDANGNTIATYYQPKILIGTVDPANSTVSAVRNAPNGAIYIKY